MEPTNGFKAWRAGKRTLFCRTGPPGYISWRSRYLGIDSLAPLTITRRNPPPSPQPRHLVPAGKWVRLPPLLPDAGAAASLPTCHEAEAAAHSLPASPTTRADLTAATAETDGTLPHTSSQEGVTAVDAAAPSHRIPSGLKRIRL